MINIKTASIVQIVLLVLSIVIAMLHWISSSVAGGLSGVKYLTPISKAYLYLACGIAIGIVVKSLGLRNNFIFSVLGIAVVICFIVIHFFFYRASGRISLTGYDWVYYLTTILLLLNSIIYLALAIKNVINK